MTGGGTVYVPPPNVHWKRSRWTSPLHGAPAMGANDDKKSDELVFAVVWLLFEEAARRVRRHGARRHVLGDVGDDGAERCVESSRGVGEVRSAGAARHRYLLKLAASREARVERISGLAPRVGG